MKQFLTILLVLSAFSAWAADIDCPSMMLRSVDKITGRTNTIEAKVGETLIIGNLKVTPQRCLKKPPEETPENAAFLLIEETIKEDQTNTVFNGWMFSSNPAISAMEHPILDIWLLECISDESHTQHLTGEKTTPPIAVKPVAVEELEEI